jgi:hypothetical protein
MYEDDNAKMQKEKDQFPAEKTVVKEGVTK